MASAGAAQQVLQQPTTTTTNNTSQPPALQIKLLSPTARAPTRGSAYAAGYDLYASKATTIPARGKVLVDTDISIAVPAGTYGRVAPRSGLASKHSIDVGAGVIDADYRGPVKVLLFNLGDSDFKVEVGERVAQLIVERVSCSSFYFIWDVMGLLDEVFEGVVFEDVMGTVCCCCGTRLPCCWNIFGKTLICADIFILTDLYPGSCRGRGTRGNRPRRRWLWLDWWLRWHWDLKSPVPDSLAWMERDLHAYTAYTSSIFGIAATESKKSNSEKKRKKKEERT